jgi:hypothetical protein
MQHRLPSRQKNEWYRGLTKLTAARNWKFESVSLQRRIWCELRICGDRRRHPPSTLSGDLRVDVVILLSSAKIGISTRSSALRRVQSMPIGAALGRLMRIAWVGVALETDGVNRGRRATSFF